jgi:hypothetical protein
MRARLVLPLSASIFLVVPALAHGQGSPQTARPIGDLVIDSKIAEPSDSKPKQDVRPALRLDFGTFPQQSADPLRTTYDPTAFGNRDRLWEFRGGSAYEVGKGVIASAQVIGRRGYRLPLYVSDMIGANQSSLDVGNTSLVDMSQLNVDWIAKVRIEKTFVRRTWDMRLVSEALVPLGRTDQTVLNPSTGVLSSRAIRFGIVLGF